MWPGLVFFALSCQLAARAVHLPYNEAISSDEVSLVQLNSFAAEEFQQGVSLEDAEPLFNLAYQAAHNESSRTLEEKAISLLQNLAQYRPLVGTSAEKALLKSAAAAQQMLDAERFEADLDEEGKLGEESNSSTAGIFDSFDWVPITGEEDTGFCWHKNGGKPLACEPISRKNGVMGTIGVDFAKEWKDKGAPNPCQYVCSVKKWCSGYGWSPGRGGKRAECLLFNDGSSTCAWKYGYLMDGVEPVLSAQDLELKTDVTDPEGNKVPLPAMPSTPYRKPRKSLASVMWSRIGEYKCVAKYKAPTSARWRELTAFREIDSAAKCQHAASTPQVPVYIKECRVVPQQLAFMMPEAWSNVCEKLCVSLKWCTGYAYRKPEKPIDSDYWTQERCSLYTKETRCPGNSDGWDDISGTKSTNTATVVIKGRSYPAKLSTHFIPDEDTRNEGWECAAKEYTSITTLKSKRGAGPMCLAMRGFALYHLGMAITSAVGMMDCTGGADSSRRASPNHTNVTLEGGIPTLATPPNVTEFLAFSGGIVENFTEGQAQSALAHYSQDTKEDSEAIAALRSMRSSDSTKCYLRQSGQSLRFLFFSIGTWLGDVQYHCNLMNQAKYTCTANAWKAAGNGVFGAGLYGVPRILQECGDNPTPVTGHQCVVDVAKATMFLGTAMVKIVLLYMSNDEPTWLDTGADVIELISSLTFVTEGILRTQGPCLGELSGDPDKINLENGGCIATYAEISALGLQALAFSGEAAARCKEHKQFGPGPR